MITQLKFQSLLLDLRLETPYDEAASLICNNRSWDEILMNILGISAYYHDSAAALLIDGKIIAAAQEEIFTRKKHTAEFPANAVKYRLGFSGYKN